MVLHPCRVCVTLGRVRYQSDQFHGLADISSTLCRIHAVTCCNIYTSNLYDFCSSKTWHHMNLVSSGDRNVYRRRNTNFGEFVNGHDDSSRILAVIPGCVIHCHHIPSALNLGSLSRTSIIHSQYMQYYRSRNDITFDVRWHLPHYFHNHKSNLLAIAISFFAFSFVAAIKQGCCIYQTGAKITQAFAKADRLSLSWDRLCTEVRKSFRGILGSHDCPSRGSAY